jgi:hypothetical protein
MHLIESAPFNIGKEKTYLGVPGNLVAFACKLSFQRGGDGYVSFLSKTKLIEHYEKNLGCRTPWWSQYGYYYRNSIKIDK